MAVNRAKTAHPVKSIVTLPGAVLPAPIVPTAAGNAVITTGVQAAPEVCVKVKLLICAFTADPVPSLESVSVQIRAFCAPFLSVIDPFRIAAEVTWKLWLTGVAAAKLVLPACVAWIVQVPTLTSVTVVPNTVQTGAVCELKPTAKSDDALALTANGAIPSTRLESAPKVMVWVPSVTLNVLSTGVAAAKVPLPACVAWMVHGPTASSVTEDPATEQVPDVRLP